MSPSTCLETHAPGKDVHEKMYCGMVESKHYLTTCQPYIMLACVSLHVFSLLQ